MIDENISHYRILEKLGGGGMGVVYEAEDVRLGRKVALKLLPEHLEPGNHSVERFQREARAASALNHPHICTIYDVGDHAGRPFIVMERLEGRTLKHRIGDSGLAIDDVLELGAQIADALEAAHAAGLVHRDVKPANVFVTERGEAKLLDFGLVKETATDRGDESDDDATWEQLTQVGAMMGTVAYMSPEQAQGRPVDGRTDLYSLGTTLYEMTTGKLPFSGSLAERFRALLDDPPDPPSRHNPEVPPQLDRIILACLVKDRQLRVQNASEIQAALRDLLRQRQTNDALSRHGHATDDLSEETLSRSMAVAAAASGAIPASKVPAPPARWRHPLVLALALASVLGVAFLLMWQRGSPDPSPDSPTIHVRRSVAVLGFQNLSGQPTDDWLSVAFTEMLSAELAASSHDVRAIAGENVARARHELGIAGSASLADDTLARVRSLLGADFVILGSYFVGSGSTARLRLDLNLQDAAAGTTVATLTETGNPDGILDLVSVMGSRLRSELGLDELSVAAADLAHATVSSDPQALRLYSEGLGRLRAYDFIAARDLLAQAITADPEHPLAHAAMAETSSALGYDQKAQEEAQKAFELSADLSREDRLFVEGRHHEMAKRWDQAIESYRGLCTFFPDNLDYGLRLAGALTEAGDGKAAIEVLEQLRRLPAPTSEDVRIELAEAEAAESSSDYRRMLAAGTAAAQKGEALGARLLEAGGRLYQASALIRLGEPRQAAVAAADARRLFAAAGDRSGEADALNRLANVAYEAGDYGEAKTIFSDALAIWRGVGNLEGLITALNNVASTLVMQGDLAAAKPLFEEALSIARERDDPVSEVLMNANLADVALRQGDLAVARATGDAAVHLGRTSNYGYGTYNGLWLLGNVALAAGELESAGQHLEEGLALASSVGDRRYIAYFSFTLGKTACAGGDLEACRRHLERSLEIRESLGSRAESAESKVALALLAIDEGRPGKAGDALEDALEIFQSQRLRDNEAHAQAALTAAALARADRPVAIAASRAAEELLSGSQNVAVRLWSEIQIAQARAAQGDPEAAAKSFAAVQAEARQRGLVLIEYQARLALAQLEYAQRPGGVSANQLRQLAEDAKTRGLLLIARKAAK